jgi:uncharacterized Zn finger protein
MSVGNWWSRRWQAALQDGEAGAEGSARAGVRVKRLEVIPGGISASVQDRQTGVCSIELRLAPLSDEQWERVGELLSEQPLVSTQLVSGTVPPEIEPIFAEAGARLLPADSSEFSCQCSCCSPRPCRHVPQIFRLVAEMLNDDPGLLLVLRGRDRQQLLREASEARGSIRRSPAPTNGQVAPSSEATAEGEPGLAAEMDQYWGNRKLIKQFHHHIAPPNVELLLLRRLGPINGSEEAMALYEQLVALYRRITEEALALAYAYDEKDDAGSLTP